MPKAEDLDNRITILETKDKEDSKKLDDIHQAIVGENGLVAKVKSHDESIRWLSKGLFSLTFVVFVVICGIGTYLLFQIENPEVYTESIKNKSSTLNTEDFKKLVEALKDK